MNRYIGLGALLCGFLPAFAQKVTYQVSFPNINHHEAQIDVTVSGATEPQLIFRMSRSSPGRYATHEFGKNIYDVKALSPEGKTLPLTRLDGDVYQTDAVEGTARVRYTLYANYPDGTYAGVDANSVHLNMPATFMWVKGMEHAPMELTFSLPAGKSWSFATQLKPTDKFNTFTAPDLQYFMDSPVKIGALIMKDWTLKNPDKQSYDFRLALEAESSDSLATAFAGKVKKITQEAQAIFGELPVFDNGKYTFLASINPYVKGDGMEHRNSTMISLPTKFDGSDNLLGVFSHEFFHAWNVERIRPQSLEPFNYEKSNMSHELWFAEGFTQYYGELILQRARFRTAEDFAGVVSSLVNTKENTPGAKRISPYDASCMAIFVDAGVSVDKTNYPNVYTSYYPYGASVALALDLELINKKLSLDHYMRAVWTKFGKTETPYKVEDLELVLEEVTGDKNFASSFFRRFVYGHESYDYAPLLAKAGMFMRKEFEGKAWMGNIRYKENSELVISANTLVGSPLYAVGVDIDDQILKLDGKTVKKESEVNAILAAHKPGDEILIEFQHRKDVVMGMVKLSENPRYIVELNEKHDLPIDGAVTVFRKRWLDSKVKK